MGMNFFIPTFVHELVKKGHVGKEKQISKHLSLDLRMDLVALQKLLGILEHLHRDTEEKMGFNKILLICLLIYT